MNAEVKIQLRAVQHFVYCKRQWGLIHIESQWAENDSVVLGNLTHSLVNDPFFNEKRRDKHISRSVPVYSDTYGIYGVADCVEFVRCSENAEGAEIPGKDGRFRITVVEYKKSKNKHFVQASFADIMQVTGQVICLEEMFGIPIDAYIYFADVKQRFAVDVSPENKRRFLTFVDEVRRFTYDGMVPPREVGQVCTGCSMSDYCMPKAKAKRGGFKTKLAELLRDDNP
ncbi:MAG: CRISPR-associated protein Cas4 [Clostridiaceae bacterium]|jgi:CRISPR-associated exonuclease Cas4|nr:CRISPR-associated protein Cas4 [Clostridiaceae bacterium]